MKLMIGQLMKLLQPYRIIIVSRGEFAGQPFEVEVDSVLAQYFLEGYFSEDRYHSYYNALLEKLEHDHQDHFPTRAELKKLTIEHSPDFATLYLAKRLLDIPANQKFHNQFIQALNKVRDAETIETQINHPVSRPEYQSYMLLFVPAWDYVKTGDELGSNFASTRKRVGTLGIENHLVEIDPLGTPDDNAKMVVQAIRYHSEHSAKSIILVSGSSSGPTVAHAIGELMDPHELQPVKAWVNAVGILRGAPFLDYFLRWPQRILLLFTAWFRRWKIKNLASMSAQVRQQRFPKIQLPGHVLTVNYLAFPLSGHISKMARMGYQLLSSEGPTDGSTFIVDALAPNSISVVAFGVDHFINFDPEVELKTVALTQTVIETLEDKTN